MGQRHHRGPAGQAVAALLAGQGGQGAGGTVLEVGERLRPLLRYVGTLTLTPARITPADAAAVFAAGWPERALHDAVSVCALFNLMNRLVDGLGVTADAGYFTTAADRLAGVGYAGLARLLPPPGSDAGQDT